MYTFLKQRVLSGISELEEMFPAASETKALIQDAILIFFPSHGKSALICPNTGGGGPEFVQDCFWVKKYHTYY